jgi:hypothetical protein
MFTSLPLAALALLPLPALATGCARHRLRSRRWHSLRHDDKRNMMISTV